MNPFYIRGFHGDEYFCDRENETQTIISAIKNQRSITLTSLRKMGKTGLIMNVGEKLKTNNHHLIYLDVLGTDNLNAFINMFGSAIFKLKEPLAKKIPRLFSAFVKSLRPTVNYDALTGMPSLAFAIDSSEKAVLTLEEIFGYLQKISEKIPVVVAIDEFQQISEYPEPNVEALLRKNVQFLSDVQFIFSGSNKHILHSMFTNAKRPFYQSTQMLHLEEIPSQKYTDFIKYHFNKSNKQISDEAIERILLLTRRHTYYVQYCCNRLFAIGKQKITVHDVEEDFKKLLLENEPYYFEYRNLITSQQWSLLIALAKENGIKEITSGQFMKSYNLSNAASIKRGVEALLKKELIFLLGEKYFVYDVFLSQWLAQKF